MQTKKITFILIIAFILLTISSMTSFLFPIHNRVDQNCFMTIGKGILNGQVLYRDLFDHKGPVIYFLHAAAAFISDTSFIGVFLIQYIFLVIFMIYMNKIVCLFVAEKHSNLITLLTTALILTTRCYLRGDNAEEYVIALMTVSLYYTLYHNIKRQDKHIPNWVFFLNGLFIGFVLWMKFNLLGYWLGWVLFIFAPMLINKCFKRFLISASLVATGIVIMTIPWLIYFGIYKSIYDLFYNYFYCNIFLYTNDYGFFEKFYLLFESVIKNFGLNPTFISITSLGIIIFLFTDRYIKDKLCRLNLFISFLILYLGVYFAGVWYDYYALITASYTIFGVIVIFDFFNEVLKVNLNEIRLFQSEKKPYRLITVFTLLISVLFSNCLPYMNMSKQDYPQYKFAQIINKKENATLLNYGFIDGGFYFAAGIQPRNKYFHKVNISKKALPEMYEEQLSMIVNKKTDFIVARLTTSKNITDVKCPQLYENYDIVTYADDENDYYRYILFERKQDD